MCECDGGCTRRDFLEQGAIAALGALLTACGGRIDFGSVTNPTGNGTATIRLGDYPSLATVGGIAIISGASAPMAAVRVATDSYAVFSLICPHAGTTVRQNGNGFRCPNHGAMWDVNGTWTGGQRTSGLARLNATLDPTTGVLTVQGVPTGRRRGGDDDDD